jgi:23S rRNA G2445 N2-methylase RlmL
MQGLIITNKGMEHIAALEVNEILNAKTEQDEYIVKFSIEKESDLDLLTKKSRAAIRILYLLGEASITKSLETTKKNILEILNNVSLDKFLKNKIYRIDCERIGKHDFKSVDLSKEMAGFLMSKGYDKADFKNPEVVVYIFINNNKGYIGIDVSKDISKRDYRIFINRKSIKGNIAYALVRESGFQKSKSLYNPFCLSGEIAIEAALHAKGDIYADDSERNMISARKNSKIANVDKIIRFEKPKNKVDIIISKLPESSKHKRKELIVKTYNEFFKENNKRLKKNGIMVLITKDLDVIKKEKAKLKIVKELIIYSGELALYATILKNAV